MFAHRQCIQTVYTKYAILFQSNQTKNMKNIQMFCHTKCSGSKLI